MVRACGEKDWRVVVHSNGNMKDGSGRTARDRNTETEVM